jgi:mannose-6-phosphate isomerase-like protein (cupin superfamily)
MLIQTLQASEFSESWIDRDDRGRWRSAPGHGPGSGAKSSGSSVLEVDPGCMVPRHTDSAEELIVVVSGSATVTVGDETATAPSGATALVPACVPHEVRNTGEQLLRFWAVYASPEVTTTYEEPVQPDGGRERSPVG